MAAVDLAPQNNPFSWPHVHAVPFAACATANAMPIARERKERSVVASILMCEDSKYLEICELHEWFCMADIL